MTMQIIRKKAFARAGVIGNPSDGYFGKTISVILKPYFAQVTLWSKTSGSTDTTEASGS